MWDDGQVLEMHTAAKSLEWVETIPSAVYVGHNMSTSF